MLNKIHWWMLGKSCHFDMNEYRDFVRETQFWSNEQMYEYHCHRLSKVICHAYNNVPFYNTLFKKEGLVPSDIKYVEDLNKIPIVRKKDVITNGQSFLAKNFEKFNPVAHHTGGTTGTPMNYYNDRKTWALNWALKMRTFEWGGFEYGKDRLGVMAGGSLIPGQTFGLKHTLWRFINNYYTMPISHISPEIMDDYASQLRKQKIKFLRGYPSAISTFADYLLQRQEYIPLRAIFTTAETLYPFQRDYIKAAFGCDTYNTYGCGDGMGYATDCECHKGMHICQEVSIMQIVDECGKDVKPGEKGEIVLTCLYDYAMPFIRYAPGDCAIKGDCVCECGRSIPTIKEIIGRTSDIIKFSNGRILNGLSLPFEELSKTVEMFQISQEQRDYVCLYLVPRAAINENTVSKYKRLLEHHCGDGVVVKVKVVNHIDVPKSGKSRYVVSKI